MPEPTEVELVGEKETKEIQGGQNSPLSVESHSDDEGFDEKNPFSDPAVAAHWKAVYEKSHYECRHVFDPELTWTEEEERKLVRKLDWRVCLWACVMFFGLQISQSHS